MEQRSKKPLIAVCIFIFTPFIAIVLMGTMCTEKSRSHLSTQLSTLPVTITQVESGNSFVITEEPKMLPESNLKMLAVKNNRGEEFIAFADSSFSGKTNERVKVEIIGYFPYQTINGEKIPHGQHNYFYAVKK